MSKFHVNGVIIVTSVIVLLYYIMIKDTSFLGFRLVPPPTTSYKTVNYHTPDNNMDLRDLVDIMKHTVPPPPASTPYAIGDEGAARMANDKQFMGKLNYEELFRGNGSGNFVEAGAFDGIGGSSTLYMEIGKGWTGLLIEPMPHTFTKLVSKKRKAWCVNAGLSITGNSTNLTMAYSTKYGMIAHIKGLANKENKKLVNVDTLPTVQVQCFPLIQILRALQIKKIDFFALDIEGIEIEVLDAFPFSEVDVSMWLIEVCHLNVTKLDAILFRNGYRAYDKFTEYHWRDKLYVKNTLSLPVLLE